MEEEGSVRPNEAQRWELLTSNPRVRASLLASWFNGGLARFGSLHLWGMHCAWSRVILILPSVQQTLGPYEIMGYPGLQQGWGQFTWFSSQTRDQSAKPLSGEVSRWLRTLAGLPDDPASAWQLTVTITPVPGALMPSSCLQGLHACMRCTYIHAGRTMIYTK